MIVAPTTTVILYITGRPWGFWEDGCLRSLTQATHTMSCKRQPFPEWIYSKEDCRKRKTDARLADDTKLEETVNMLKGRPAIQRNLYKTEEWVIRTSWNSSEINAWEAGPPCNATFWGVALLKDLEGLAVSWAWDHNESLQQSRPAVSCTIWTTAQLIAQGECLLPSTQLLLHHIWMQCPVLLPPVQDTDKPEQVCRTVTKMVKDYNTCPVRRI